jgi:poly-gamma-glutamate capsule biosynthesis protein CapA/YwtB (metallophosphatase superfamily)
LEKLRELVELAKEIIAGDPDRVSLWRAYIALEYAVTDIKLRHKLDGEVQPIKSSKKAINMENARSMLAGIDLSADKKKVLYDLRSCRNVVKGLLADYGRRSTIS